MSGFGIPEVSDVPLFYPAEAAESTIVQRGIVYWNGLRGARRFPRREEVSLRGLGCLAQYTVIVRVLDGGSDFEFRVVGNVPVTAVGQNFQGRRLSEPEVGAVMQNNYRAKLYAEVVRTGEPRVFKCRMLGEKGLRLPVRSESVFLPLGAETVDHLLGFTVFSCDS